MSEKEKREKILKELYDEYQIDEMVKFSELDLGEKIQDNSFWIVRFGDLYAQAQAEYDYLEELLEKLQGQRYDYYRFEFDKALDKTEIKNFYLPKDEKIIQMKRILARQKVKVEFYKLALKGFEKQQWNMKTFQDVLKGNL